MPDIRHGRGNVFFILPDSNFSIGNVPIHGLITDTLTDIRDRLYSAAVRIAPQEEGELRARGIQKLATRRVSANRWRSGIGLSKSVKHGIWVHDGTGIYGPRKTPIKPRKSPYLRFTIGDREFRLRSVRGQKPQRFMDKAFILVNRTYVPIRVERLRILIQAFAQNQ